MRYGHCSVLAGLLLFPALNTYAGNIGDDIYQAALAKDAGIIESYLRSGISIDTADAEGMSALCKAYEQEQWQAYEFLLQYGANANAACMIKKSDAAVRNAWIGAGLLATGGAVIRVMLDTLKRLM